MYLSVKRNPRGPIQIQLVHVGAYTKAAQDAKAKVTDLDVNNLKITTANGLCKKVETEGGSLESIILNCQKKVYCTVKETSLIKHRIQKMNRRHWHKLN